jgi:hypothetical protein
MKRLLVLAALAALALLAAAPPASATTTLRLYTDPAEFRSALAGAPCPLKTVTFDDIPVTAPAAAFSSTRYRMDRGMVITAAGGGGQYAGPGFGFPLEFPPVSSPNDYAPGPIAVAGSAPAGGHETEVSFWAAGRTMKAAAFGCFFIDADYPGRAPSWFAVFDAQGLQLGATGVVAGINASQHFAGLVAVDSESGAPVPAIARVRINSGDEWPANQNSEGVALDDFMAAIPSFDVTGKVVRASGKPLAGVKVTLRAAGFSRSVRTSAKGRYAFGNVPAGIWKVKPSRAGWSFSPTQRSAKVTTKSVALKAFRAR